MFWLAEDGSFQASSSCTKAKHGYLYSKSNPPSDPSDKQYWLLTATPATDPYSSHDLVQTPSPPAFDSSLQGVHNSLHIRQDNARMQGWYDSTLFGNFRIRIY